MSCPDCERTAARLRELQDELDAWRADEAAAIETEAAAVRLMRWRNRLEGQRSNPVRTLILLADFKGRVVSFDRVAGLGGRSPDDLASPFNLAANSICHARASLRPLGLAAGLQSVRGLGYRLEPEAAQRLRELMGDFEFGDIREPSP